MCTSIGLIYFVRNPKQVHFYKLIKHSIHTTRLRCSTCPLLFWLLGIESRDFWLIIQFIQLKIKTWQIPEKDWGALHVIYFFGCWELSQVIFDFWSWERKNCLQSWANLQNDIYFHPKQQPRIVEVKVWICSALQAVLCFSAWEKSRDSTSNSIKQGTCRAPEEFA